MGGSAASMGGFHPSSSLSISLSSLLQTYWKIGVTTPDVNEAVSRLRQSGVDVGDGHQFLDIAFLTDIIADPGGFGIEILQHDFSQNFV